MAGSTSNTSNATPATLPLSRATFSADSSIRPPRAQLMTRTPSFIIAKAFFPRIPRVTSIRGVCSEIKSARLRRSLKTTFSTPISSARSSDKNGSKAITFILRPMARLATIAPILPQPIIPRVFEVSSTPIKRDFSHLPA